MKLQKDLVSVVIPAYNAEKSIKRCIESAFNQTYQATEIIIVNDGSSDGTEEIAKGYGSRIIYVTQNNRGKLLRGTKASRLQKGSLSPLLTTMIIGIRILFNLACLSFAKIRTLLLSALAASIPMLSEKRRYSCLFSCPISKNNQEPLLL